MIVPGDQVGLLRDQYRDDRNLAARTRLHQRFGTAAEPWARWVFDRLEIAPGSMVLELGCGTGALWAGNHDRLPRDLRAVLTDLSGGMLGVARRALAEREPPFRFAQADAQALPFGDEAFDLVVANHMLYHVPDRARAIAELRRVLRQGGRLCAATNGRAHLQEIDALVRRFLPGAAMDGSADSFGLENGDEQLGRAFAHVELLRYDDALVITEAEPVVEYVASLAGERATAAEALASLRRHVEEIIAKEGAFRVRKDVGLFVAS